MRNQFLRLGVASAAMVVALSCTLSSPHAQDNGDGTTTVSCQDANFNVVACGRSSSGYAGPANPSFGAFFTNLGNFITFGAFSRPSHPSAPSPADIERQRRLERAYALNQEGVALSNTGEHAAALAKYREASLHGGSDSGMDNAIRANISIAEAMLAYKVGNLQLALDKAREAVRASDVPSLRSILADLERLNAEHNKVQQDVASLISNVRDLARPSDQSTSGASAGLAFLPANTAYPRTTCAGGNRAVCDAERASAHGTTGAQILDRTGISLGSVTGPGEGGVVGAGCAFDGSGDCTGASQPQVTANVSATVGRSPRYQVPAEFAGKPDIARLERQRAALEQQFAALERQRAIIKQKRDTEPDPLKRGTLDVQLTQMDSDKSAIPGKLRTLEIEQETAVTKYRSYNIKFGGEALAGERRTPNP